MKTVLILLLLLSGCAIQADRIERIQALCEPNGGLSEIEYNRNGWCNNGALFNSAATRVE